MKTVMVLLMVAVLAALASAGVFMLRKNPSDATGKPAKQMARALALRVALSVALFLFILLSWTMGWVQPTGIPIGR